MRCSEADTAQRAVTWISLSGGQTVGDEATLVMTWEKPLDSMCHTTNIV